MQLYYSKILNENDRIKDLRDVNVFYDSEGNLIFKCCDINDTAKKLYGDSGVEFYVTIEKSNLTKVAEIAGIFPKQNWFGSILNLQRRKNEVDKISQDAILNYFVSQYKNDAECFQKIQHYLKAKKIKYKFEKW